MFLPKQASYHHAQRTGTLTCDCSVVLAVSSGGGSKQVVNPGSQVGHTQNGTDAHVHHTGLLWKRPSSAETSRKQTTVSSIAPVPPPPPLLRRPVPEWQGPLSAVAWAPGRQVLHHRNAQSR